MIPQNPKYYDTLFDELIDLICDLCYIKCQNFKVLQKVPSYDYGKFTEYNAMFLEKIKSYQITMLSLSESFLQESPCLSKVNQFFRLRSDFLLFLRSIIVMHVKSTLSIYHDQEFYQKCNVELGYYNEINYNQILTKYFNNLKQLKLLNTQHDIYLPNFYNKGIKENDMSPINNNIKFLFYELALIDTKYSQLYKIAKESNNESEMKEIYQSAFHVIYNMLSIFGADVKFIYKKDKALKIIVTVILSIFMINSIFLPLFLDKHIYKLLGKNVFYGSIGLSILLLLFVKGLSIYYLMGRKGHNKSLNNLTDYIHKISNSMDNPSFSNGETVNTGVELNDDLLLLSKVTESGKVKSADAKLALN
ncbi:hypothetical protein HL033_04495 [Neoehrlichia mikurensis]|uniref:Uncharacterized protein n=1 Tax=Neoehrlichia mikurensis TaxID=89586 RepID=A0A9Q9BWZ8_9RICK|nr:hypothetical protein [Neoehrlichia mikurensis]QXK91970.1 hypothetical protein IAH97_04495 [Neoehrlichia mikurensis]QXK93184.1 hypothetical protein HUN61_04490 [Neoehrlichia mikurensis]QXK93662.1 hypothetical protein HL033_04495 [Neoehrlichia mikurensis]UTO55381.1 hypothetical protein LUA82_04355 [Neoehrlichia mikurensis]UTO56300.1 hypothetical protein LUA81_04305 [Neoehrlichia mikurensis]